MISQWGLEIWLARGGRRVGGGGARTLLIKITLTFYIGIRIGTKMSFLEMKILKIVVMKLP